MAADINQNGVSVSGPKAQCKDLGSSIHVLEHPQDSNSSLLVSLAQLTLNPTPSPPSAALTSQAGPTPSNNTWVSNIVKSASFQPTPSISKKEAKKKRRQLRSKIWKTQKMIRKMNIGATQAIPKPSSLASGEGKRKRLETLMASDDDGDKDSSVRPGGRLVRIGSLRAAKRNKQLRFEIVVPQWLRLPGAEKAQTEAAGTPEAKLEEQPQLRSSSSQAKRLSRRGAIREATDPERREEIAKESREKRRRWQADRRRRRAARKREEKTAKLVEIMEEEVDEAMEEGIGEEIQENMAGEETQRELKRGQVGSQNRSQSLPIRRKQVSFGLGVSSSGLI